jgi:Putative peptidoglycan binding domain
VIMYDSIDVSQIPADAQAVAGYVDGHWQTVGELQSRFPRALLLSITVTGADAHATAVDEEPGDASVAAAVAWLKGAVARGVWRPCAYASVSGMGALLAAAGAAGLDLSGLRFWSAHYGAGEHICGPSSCKLVNREMDATQWTDSALGRNLDESLLAEGFFPWYASVMADIPTVQSGSTGQAVKNWQGLLGAHGHAVTIDGSFGSGTEAATKAYQSSAGLAADGVAGPDTWTAALAG